MAVEEEKDSLEVLHTQQQATLITLRANLQEERTRTPQTQHTKQLSSVCLWFVVTCLVLLFYTHSVQVTRYTYHNCSHYSVEGEGNCIAETRERAFSETDRNGEDQLNT